MESPISSFRSFVHLGAIIGPDGSKALLVWAEFCPKEDFQEDVNPPLAETSGKARWKWKNGGIGQPVV